MFLGHVQRLRVCGKLKRSTGYYAMFSISFVRFVKGFEEMLESILLIFL
jgi:hypothetical protein